MLFFLASHVAKQVSAVVVGVLVDSTALEYFAQLVLEEEQVLLELLSLALELLAKELLILEWGLYLVAGYPWLGEDLELAPERVASERVVVAHEGLANFLVVDAMLVEQFVELLLTVAVVVLLEWAVVEVADSQQRAEAIEAVQKILQAAEAGSEYGAADDRLLPMERRARYLENDTKILVAFEAVSKLLVLRSFD